MCIYVNMSVTGPIWVLQVVHYIIKKDKGKKTNINMHTWNIKKIIDVAYQAKGYK